MSSIDLAIFSSRISAVCDEMGAVLKRAAFSPNIKDRLDYSCAIFDSKGNLCAQAAHIPVHLGSMAYAMSGIIERFDWHDGDMVIVNDPFLGGTHLPDVTLIAPVFYDGALIGFVANRAHHVNIGSDSPGSMPISSSLEEEGIVISPTKIIDQSVLDESLLEKLAHSFEAKGDYLAQVGANKSGVTRLTELVTRTGVESYLAQLNDLNAYGRRLAQAELSRITPGEYEFSDVMDGDGITSDPITIRCKLRVSKHGIVADFTGTSAQVAGNVNCPLSVTAAGVFYAFRCLLPDYTPACAGAFSVIDIIAPDGCLLNANYPAAVAAGNVETSTRVVDAVLGALSQADVTLAASASHGSMNNIAMGSHDSQHPWDYYETIGGGMGASVNGSGLSCVQTHMTNTLNTPIESLESHFPIQITEYSIRKHSGGEGLFYGGDGIVREFEFLSDTQVTLLTERRQHQPWGLNGGSAGKVGCNWLNGELLAPKVSLQVKAGDRVRIETPGGGGWGEPNS
ncbi:hydantoinase B/oxoprolinase family protein [Sessilibacter corallicola]|uniref:Hydantoinase B/oxoprolinase family protein n=1 Tax=Sessilibacter corallicola TaxID=2904075 RepID=A0ABQ0A3Z2_9GAMM